MSQQSMSTHAVESPPLVGYHLLFYFVTDGANNPDEFAGTIGSITRLTSTLGIPFYRVRLGDPDDGRVLADRRNLFSLSLKVLADIENGERLEAELPIGLQLPSTPPARESEVDIVVYDAGVPTNSVAAGRRVLAHLCYERYIPNP